MSLCKRGFLSGSLVIVLTAMLAACGGSSSSSSSSGNSSAQSSGGTVSGTVTGFGSIVVDGQEYPETSNTQYQIAASNANASLPSNSVQLGNQVDLTLDAKGNITHVVVIPQVEGTVTSITSTVTEASGATATAAITVSGVLVVANTDSTKGPLTTYGGGYTAFTDIAVSDNITVHGLLLSASGVDYVQATYIAKQDTFTGTRITGTVAGFDSTTDTFTLGSGSNTITVNATGATLLPATASIANGEVVNVWTNTALSSNSLTAKVIRVRKNSSVAGTTLGVSGQISNYVSQADFVVNGVTVDASALTLPKDITALSNGLMVSVVGTLNSSGVLVASKLHIYKSQDNTAPPVTLTGTISNFVSSASFTVRGVTVDASQSPTFSSGSAASLANGVFVTVTGSLTDNTVVATNVQFPTMPSGAVVDLKATVTSYVPASAATASSALTTASGVLSVTVKLPGKQASEALALTLNNTPIIDGTTASLASGTLVEVHGLLNEATNTFTVTTLTIVPSTPSVGYPVVLIQGVITAVNTATVTPMETNLSGTTTTEVIQASIVVNGLTIGVESVSPSTDQNSASFSVGDRVTVYANVASGNVITAYKVVDHTTGIQFIVETEPV